MVTWSGLATLARARPEASLAKTTFRDHNVPVTFPDQRILLVICIKGSCLWLVFLRLLCPRMNLVEQGQRVSRTNLIVKFILCLILPAYHTVQAELGMMMMMMILMVIITLSRSQ